MNLILIWNTICLFNFTSVKTSIVLIAYIIFFYWLCSLPTKWAWSFSFWLEFLHLNKLELAIPVVRTLGLVFKYDLLVLPCIILIWTLSLVFIWKQYVYILLYIEFSSFIQSPGFWRHHLWIGWSMMDLRIVCIYRSKVIIPDLHILRVILRSTLWCKLIWPEVFELIGAISVNWLPLLLRLQLWIRAPISRDCIVSRWFKLDLIIVAITIFI